MEKVAGLLQVTRTGDGRKVVISYPDAEPDENGDRAIALTPRQARHFASVLIIAAQEAEGEWPGAKPLKRA